MNDSSAVQVFLRRFFALSGRSGRRECWLTVLAIIPVWFIFLMSVSDGFKATVFSGGFQSSFIESLVFLPAVLLLLPVHVRRLHDLNLSGWWLLLFWILDTTPIIGTIVQFIELVVFGCIPGTDGANKYGPNPLKGKVEQNSPMVEAPEDRLLKLSKLMENGILTREEYEEKRKKLLEEI